VAEAENIWSIHCCNYLCTESGMTKVQRNLGKQSLRSRTWDRAS
jgi:hypothetical protein